MNLIAIDIGNTNIRIGLFLDGEEKSVESVSGGSPDELKSIIQASWEKIPIANRSKDKKRDGVIVVSSVKPQWTEAVRTIIEDFLKEKMMLIGDNIPLPMAMWVDDPAKVGTDRCIAAAAAFCFFNSRRRKCRQVQPSDVSDKSDGSDTSDSHA